MADIDKLLQIALKNKEDETPDYTEYYIKEVDQTFHVRPLTRKERNEITLKAINIENDLQGFIKGNYSFIYKCVQELKETALKAKEKNAIKRYEDIIELLFEMPTIIRLWEYIVDISNFKVNSVKEDIEEIKK